MHTTNIPTWTKVVLVLSGIYNIVWGGLVAAFPAEFLALGGFTNLDPLTLTLMKGMAMMVAVYGLTYIVAAPNYLKYWPVVLAGFLARVFGPIGFLINVQEGVFTWDIGIMIIFNDLIWLPFYAVMMFGIYKHLRAK
ncbi:MAG: Putative membrane protein [uncultured Sulfurovum sp.]|uniref:Membrane protein n=1 Tax=uncultured Sulfurovum sp. TaxID=269237 RepID=A0A6S6S8J3_9BACT|nr:MAG: Putative membrane protein [uncultured Sulfurovum sp.]